MLEIIIDPKKITPEWMTTALRQSGHLQDGEVNSVEYKIIGTGKMGDNARFTLCYSGNAKGAPKTVVAKFPAQDESTRMIAGARGAYYNEVMFYKVLANRASMRTPVIYANEISESRMDFVTVMEDMAPAEPGSQLVGESQEHTQLVMKEAAKLAASFYGDDTITAYDHVLTPTDDGGALGQELLQQYTPGFLERFGHGLNAECIAFIENYIQNHCKFIMLDAGPKTLVHGDFRSENILFHNDTACTVDWQTVCQSSPLADLAYFMGGSVNIDDRRSWERDLVQAYAGELSANGVDLGFDESWRQYRQQAMHGLLITILGASFSDPEERGDAMFLAMIQRHAQHCVDLDAAEFLA